MKRNRYGQGEVQNSAFKRQVVSDTILLGTGAAHSAQDVVSTDAGENLEFVLAEFDPGVGVRIQDILVYHNNNAVFSSGNGYVLHLYNAAPTAQATNAAFNLTAADAAKYLGNVAVAVLVDHGDCCMIFETEDFGFVVPDNRTIYGKLVAVGGETTVTGKTITIKLGVEGAA